MRTNPVINGGFTLVELLVALTIFSGLILTLFSSFNAFNASGKRIKALEETRDQEHAGMETITGDLEQTFILHPPQFRVPEKRYQETAAPFAFIADEDQAGGITASTLTFASLTQVRFHHPPDTGIARLRYYVHDHGGRLDIHRSDTPAYLPDAEKNPCTDPVLFRDIKGFDLTFYDRSGKEFDRWHSARETFEYALPSRVGIRIALNRAGAENIVQATIPLRVNRKVKK